MEFNLTGNSCENTRLTEESAKQREQCIGFRVDCEPNGPLASYFANLLWQSRLRRSGDTGQNRWRRQLRLSDDRSGAPVESKIGEVRLGQNQDQREQAELEDKEDPKPPLHEIPTLRKELIPIPPGAVNRDSSLFH